MKVKVRIRFPKEEITEKLIEMSYVPREGDCLHFSTGDEKGNWYTDCVTWDLQDDWLNEVQIDLIRLNDYNYEEYRTK